MRVGVVGCGTIAQVMHLPYLAEIPGFDLDALVDPAANVRGELGDRYGVEHRFGTVEALLEERARALDGVVVCTPPQVHADAAIPALEAGLHTFVEKPLALTVREADRLVDAAAASPATAMVGYNKRYDPSYERMADRVDALSGVDLVTAYDTDPDHGRIIEEVYDIVRGDLPESVLDESRTRRHERCTEAIGTDDDALAEAYSFQVEHVCHDVNALRGLFGAVEGIRHADVFADGRYATAHCVYEGGVPCVLETGVADRKWFEEWLRVDGPDGMVRLEFGNPYIRNAPTELRVKTGTEELDDAVDFPSYEESFKRELERFLACAEDGATVRTPFAEAREDVRLIADLFRAHRGGPTHGDYSEVQ
ncbi:MAG: Gfo/Idh/MocA family protein [Halobacteriales archaeon]